MPQLRRHWLLMVVAFALLLMTYVNLEQQKTIAAQRTTIETFSRDSMAYFHLVAQNRREHPKSKAK